MVFSRSSYYFLLSFLLIAPSIQDCSDFSAGKAFTVNGTVRRISPYIFNCSDLSSNSDESSTCTASSGDSFESYDRFFNVTINDQSKADALWKTISDVTKRALFLNQTITGSLSNSSFFMPNRSSGFIAFRNDFECFAGVVKDGCGNIAANTPIRACKPAIIGDDGAAKPMVTNIDGRLMIQGLSFFQNATVNATQRANNQDPDSTPPKPSSSASPSPSKTETPAAPSHTGTASDPSFAQAAMFAMLSAFLTTALMC